MKPLRHVKREMARDDTKIHASACHHRNCCRSILDSQATTKDYLGSASRNNLKYPPFPLQHKHLDSLFPANTFDTHSCRPCSTTPIAPTIYHEPSDSKSQLEPSTVTAQEHLKFIRPGLERISGLRGPSITNLSGQQIHTQDVRRVGLVWRPKCPEEKRHS
jgi:hypothetical protein